MQTRVKKKSLSKVEIHISTEQREQSSTYLAISALENGFAGEWGNEWCDVALTAGCPPADSTDCLMFSSLATSGTAQVWLAKGAEPAGCPQQ